MYKLILFFLIIQFSNALFAETLTISTGFNKDEAKYLKSVMQEIFKQTPYTLKFQKLPNKRSLLNANAGIVDGEAARIYTINKKYKNLIPVTPEIYSIDIVLMNEKNIFLKGMKDLKNYNIGVVRGVKITETIAQSLEPKTLLQATSYKNLIHMLLNGRIDFVVVNKIGMLSELKNMQEKTFYIKKEVLVSVKVYMQLHKKHQKLLPLFHTILQKMHDNGFFKKNNLLVVRPFKKNIESFVKVSYYD